MKLFLDRNKTLLPRIDTIYMLSRILALASISWFGYFRGLPQGDMLLFDFILATYIAHLVLFYAATKGRFDIKLAYLSAIVYDILLVPLLVLYTESVNSAFYPLFYLTISVAAYVLTFWFSLAAVVLVTIGYVISVYNVFTLEALFDLSVRVGFIWVYYLAILYASDYMRRSERRLLKVFDTLNMRTSELEKSQAQLEMIYENTRILASILEPDAVVREVMRIMGNLLRYRSYALIFKDKLGNFYYRARSEAGKTNFALKAIDISRMELVRKVSNVGESIIVKDILKREDYEGLAEKSRSALITVMTAHGLTNGIIVAESEDVDHFKQRDVQMMSAVARSAALAMENAELHKKTEELTVIDELTETYNYRYFVQKLEEEKRRAIRYDQPLSLIMVDIDWFKKLNDSYGHEVGNVVLKGLSAIIKQCIRDVDIFTRYGGEEFAIILPQTTLKEASVIGERIRERVEKEVFDAGRLGKLRITVSVGVSSYPENGKAEEELLAVTDQALYRAKGEGRNLVRII